MKSTKTILIILTVLCTTLYFSCKKSTEDPAPAPPNPTGSPNYLCDGNGDTTYYPLDSANTWTYYYRIFGVNQTSPHITITGHTNVGGHKYSVLTDATLLMYSTPYLLREDSVSHDIINFNTSNLQSYLEVPHTPVVGYDWILQGVATHRTVTNLSATYTSSSCTYNGLLEITQYDGTTVTAILYYKKGLGLVKRTDPGAVPDEYEAKAATLY